MSHLAKSRRPSNTVLRLLLAYLVLTSTLPVPAATAQVKAKATPPAPARKSEQQAPRSGARASKDRITPNALQASGKIAFVGGTTDNEVFVMNADGSVQANLTNNPAIDENPAWSPDGKQLAFVSDRDGDFEIFVMQADGSVVTQLTSNALDDAEPAWSPDGSKFAFQSNRDGNDEIYLMDANGNNQVRLTNNAAHDGKPAWSPDGSKLAFESDRDGNREIYSMNPDGSAPVNLTNNPAFDSAPAWSPDGSKIAFASDRAAGDEEIFTINANGTNPLRLTTSAGSDTRPTWSPDNTRIAFNSTRTGTDNIFVMDANGASPTQLTNDPNGSTQADWQTLLSCAPPPPNGVAWYRAEENADDSIGTNHGALQNGTAISQGFVGAAFDLDGVDDQVDIGQLTDLQNAQQLTLMAWVKKRDLNNTIAGIMGKWDGCAGCTDDTFLLYNGEGGNTNKGGFVVRFTDDTAAAVAGATNIPAGQWIHIAATWRSSDGEIKIYKNGRLDGSGTGGAGKTLKHQTNYTAKIGEWGEGHGGNPLYRFSGAIDEAIIFNRALSQTEIKNVYDAKNAGQCLASAAQTITTSNTNDSGPGSLRQAILDANASPGTQTIDFNIPGAGVHTITPDTPLPGITDPVIIDGYTQPGASANSLATGSNAQLLIELDGTNANIDTGLQLLGGGATIRGLVINRFLGGIAVVSNNNVVAGNFIGTDAAGTAVLGNINHGVNLALATNNTIGGATPEARNLISGNIIGVAFENNSDANTVQGNYIGTDKNGTIDLGNSNSGIYIYNGSDNNLIGGTTAAARNVISGNDAHGLHFDVPSVSGNIVQGNFIGTQADGVSALGNTGSGINLDAVGANIIGGTAAGAGNTIAFNGGRGVNSNSATTNGIAIRSNSIYSNTDLGIDLGNNGVTSNDAGDTDTGANNLQNFPVLTSVTASGGNTVIQGTLNSVANRQFAVEFFSNPACDASGNGEGKTFIGSTDVTTDGSGNATINATLAGAATIGDAVTATATDLAGNTSEFSACRTVLSGVATNVSWINAAGGAWNVAANWQDGNGVNRVPDAGDDAIINLAGTYTVTLGSAVTVNTINLGAASGAQTLDTSNFALTIANNSNVAARGVLVVNGTLNGAGNLSVNGTLEHRGTLSGTGTVSIAAAATLNINGNQPTLSRTLNNSGTANYNVTNSMLVSNGTFNNLAGATFDVLVEKLLFQSGGASAFNNAGTVRKLVGADTTEFRLPFNNSGTVTLQSGTLHFSSGGTSAGQFNGGAGTTLKFDAHTLQAASSTSAPNVFFNGVCNIAGSYNVATSTTTSGTINFTGNVVSVGNTLDITSGTTSFNSNNVTAQNITVGGTLAGTANVGPTATGTFNFRGILAGTGTTDIPAGATLNLDGSQPTLSRTINNSGTTNYSVTNSMVFSNGTFNNLPGATFDVLAEKLLFQTGGTNLFSNTGTLRKLSGAGTTNISVPFNNNGTVTLQSGTLEFATSGTSAGQFNGGAGTTFRLNSQTLQAAASVAAPNVVLSGTNNVAGSYNVTGTSTLSGTNTFNGNVVSVGNTLDITSGTTNFNSNNVTAQNITVGGTLAGSASVSPTATGTFNFNGTMSGTGTTDIPAGATLNIGGSQPVLSRTLNNSGTANYVVTNSFFFSNGTFNNLAGGLFDARVDKLIFASGGTNAFNNAGTLQKTQGAGTTDLSLNFTNTGTVESKSGTLAFNTVYNQSAGTTKLNGGNLSTITLLNIQGGTLSGTGTITGNVQNAGTLAPGLSPGVLNIAGNYTQLSSGILAIEIGGTNVGSQYDQLNVTGTATLDGALNATLTGGYNPGFNDQIVVLTYGTRSGTFSAVNANALTPAYNANNLTLTSNAAPPTILAVTNTNDAGAGSLRQAIIDSNAMAGVQSISFQIPVGGVQTITLASLLPQITDAVVIDGYTQPNTSANTQAVGDNAVLLVELNGVNVSGHGLNISAGGTTIRGLVINRFNGAGINISSGGNNRIEGNFIGTNAAGTAALANSRGVDVANSQNNSIGGTSPAARNLFSGNSQGVQLTAGATGTLVQGNYIGTTASGTTALANTFAGVLLLTTSGNTVGGTVAGAGNLISGNTEGIVITQGATNNTVQGNFIGTASDGVVALPNAQSGIGIALNSNGNQIGGVGAGAVNTIAFNGGSGVLVNAAVNNPVVGNSIHSNNALGLDLLPAGVTPNDAGDADAGANNLQNFPVLSAVTVANGNTTFNGTLASAANTTYALHFYSNAACDASGNGEGQTYLGTTVLSTNASGDAAFNSTINGLAVPSNQFVTATATDPTGNTSEFSACVQVSSPPATFTISGQILEGANGLSGITVTLSGTQSATTITDANGNYTFASVATGGNYVVTPSLTNYTFTPPTQSFNNLSANQTANFAATLNAYTISGQVTEGGSGLGGVFVTLTRTGSQSNVTTTTDASGNYSFTNVAAGGDYIATPSHPNYTFTPANRQFGNLNANGTANFTATLNALTISGQVTENGGALSGVTITLSGTQSGTATTDASGNYAFNVTAGGSYTVTPTLTHYTFNPPSQSFNNQSSNQTANFLASSLPTQPQPVSGRVLGSNGVGIGNVTLYVTDATTGASVVLSNGQPVIATTDANGNYTFMLPPGGDYTITTAKAGLTFQPAARTFGNLSGGQTSNFTATEGLSISGRVTGANHNGIGNVVITLSGAVTRTALTLPNGSFLFINLPANGDYVVRADSGLLTFDPPQIVRPDLASNATLNLVAAPREVPVPTPSIEEDFGGTTRDPLKFTEGTLTQPAGSKDPLVTVVQEGGVLKITPRSGISEASFNGYVTSRAIDFTDATASVEVNQTADNGAQTVFGLGRDERNFFRFIAEDVDDSPIPAAKAGVATKQAAGLRRLIFQARSAGVLNGLPPSIPFDPVQHRFWRFRHSSAESAMFFETSPDRSNWTVQRRVALNGPIGLLACELSAGTSGLVTTPGQAIFDNLLIQPSAVLNRVIVDDFDGTKRDPSKFIEGTLTQPAGSKDPLVTVVQEGGVLKITLRSGISEASFNGYVTVRTIDFTDAEASVEVNQIADNGAQTIFAVGRDENNFFRFVAQDVDASLLSSTEAGAATKRTLGLRRLIFEARGAGVLNGLQASIEYNSNDHRFWRFRHISAQNVMLFETSPDRVNWTERHRVALGAPIGALAVELGAGTSRSVTNPGQAIFDNLLVQPSGVVNVRLAQSTYRVSEGAGILTLKATRAGDTSQEMRLDYATEPHDGKPCNTQDSKARARCDFGTTAGTIRFAPGETEKSFSVFITDDIYAEGNETVRIALGFPSAGVVVGAPASALVTIVDNDAGSTPHPINAAPFLVRQQYLDFLNREPEENGFNAWVGVLRGCAFEGHFGPGKSGSDPACDRITVSSSFFRSQEFQFKGYFVYRFYKASLGRVPTYEEFLRDMTSVTGQTEAEVLARREAFAQAWVERADFVALNEGITNAEFVDQLAATAGVPIAGRAQLIVDLNEGGKTRAQVLRIVVDSPELFNREYNAAFVLMQYFGYLQRDPDEAGYNSWLNLLNRTGDYRTMIFGFLYSQEYLLRFGQP